MKTIHIYASALAIGAQRLAAIGLTKKEAAKAIRSFANGVNLCPWHDYSDAEVYEGLIIADSSEAPNLTFVNYPCSTVLDANRFCAAQDFIQRIRG